MRRRLRELAVLVAVGGLMMAGCSSSDKKASVTDAQGKNVVKKQYRDIIMNWQDQALLMLLAVESQTSITESKSMVSTFSFCCLRVYSSRLSI